MSLCLCGSFLFAAASHGAEPREAVPVTGTPFKAELSSVDSQWQATFALPKEKKQLAAAELVSWGAPAEVAAGPLVFFVDGSLLAQPTPPTGQAPAALSLDKDQLKLDRSLFGPLALPVELLRGIVFHPPEDSQRRDRLSTRLLADVSADDKPLDSDRLILENGDELLGNVLSLDGAKIELETAVGKAQVEVARVAALAFNPSLAARVRAAGLRALVGFRDGSRLAAAKLTLTGDKLELWPLDGAAFDAPWKAPAEAIIFLQPLGGRATYVSDLPVESYKHVPYLTLAWPYRVDRNVSGSSLRAGGRQYAKGLGMHSASRITYRLDKPYRRFDVELAIDDLTSGRGSVVFRVVADREVKFTSDVIRGGAPPVPVSVDIAGAKQLSLVIDFAEQGDEMDRADWLNARLVE